MPFHIRRKKTLNISAKHKENLIELLPNSAGDIKSNTKLFCGYVEKIHPETTRGSWHYIAGPSVPGKIVIKEGKASRSFFPWIISWSK